MAKILLIEDDECFRVVMRRVFEQRGFEVIEAESATTGIRLASAIMPDLIVSDVQMENGDGYAILIALRQSKETEAIPVILMTGQASLAGMRRCMDQGADDYLQKPFSFDAMLAAVHARLKKRDALERQIRSRLAHQGSLPEPMIEHLSHPITRRN